MDNVFRFRNNMEICIIPFFFDKISRLLLALTFCRRTCIILQRKILNYGFKKAVVKMHLQESGEMYLETILILSHSGAVRSLDVANYMGFSKPSVSRAVSLLRQGGFIEVDKNGFITLTEAGSEVAESIYERHRLLTSFLMRLGVDENTAAEDACKIEHDISAESFEAIKRHVSEYGG